MEDTLRGWCREHAAIKGTCLNPCFNGRYSQRIASIALMIKSSVLILVLMEDTLREKVIVKSG